jgi:nitrogen fixation/metabolism regulation signal transduction histidine kinase
MGPTVILQLGIHIPIWLLLTSKSKIESSKAFNEAVLSTLTTELFEVHEMKAQLTIMKRMRFEIFFDI